MDGAAKGTGAAAVAAADDHDGTAGGAGSTGINGGVEEAEPSGSVRLSAEALLSMSERDEGDSWTDRLPSFSAHARDDASSVSVDRGSDQDDEPQGDSVFYPVW